MGSVSAVEERRRDHPAARLLASATADSDGVVLDVAERLVNSLMQRVLDDCLAGIVGCGPGDPG